MRLSRAIFLVAALTLLAACKTPMPHDVAIEDKSTGAGSTNPSSGDTRNGMGGTGGTTELGNPDDASLNQGELAKRSIFFDYDAYQIKDEYKPVLLAHSKYLIKHPKVHIMIQGNTDERGASEYNLALGTKRAEAVRQALTALGVNDAQIEAVSLGKDKPLANGHDESSWAQNRRADIVY